MSNPCLQWLDNNHGIQRLEVVDKVFIGREWKGIDATKCIVVNHPMASREHAMITFSGSNFQIADIFQFFTKPGFFRGLCADEGNI